MACIYCWNGKKLKQLSLPPYFCFWWHWASAWRWSRHCQAGCPRESCILLHSSTSDGQWYFSCPSRLFSVPSVWSMSNFGKRTSCLISLWHMAEKKKKKRPKYLLGKPTAVMQIIVSHVQLIDFLFCVVFHTERWGKREVFKNRKMWLRKHHYWQEDSVDSGNNVTPLFIML